MTKHCLVAAIAVATAVFANCSIGDKAAAQRSAQRIVDFVNTGDTTFLQGVFSDSVLQLMSIDKMLATREEFITRFGVLRTVDGPTFQNDSSVTVVLRYEQLSLLALLEFTSDGHIHYLSIQPEPVASVSRGDGAQVVRDIEDIASFRSAFNADSGYVRLVTLLSPA